MKELGFAVLLLLIMAGCDRTDADLASYNMSKAADNFEINRRIVFVNGITDTYLLSIEGRCSFEAEVKKLTVVCKIGPYEYKKHSLGLSDNVTWFSEQLEAAPVSVYHYRVVFKPQSILPDVDFKGSSQEFLNMGIKK